MFIKDVIGVAVLNWMHWFALRAALTHLAFCCLLCQQIDVSHHHHHHETHVEQQSTVLAYRLHVAIAAFN